MLLDHLVLGLDLITGQVLGWREPVLDDLEHVGIGGQGEHTHYHTLDTGCRDEVVTGVFQVVCGITRARKFTTAAGTSVFTMK